MIEPASHPLHSIINNQFEATLAKRTVSTLILTQSLIGKLSVIFHMVWLTFLLLCYSASVWALASDKDMPYYINANKAIYDRNQHLTTYLGNVHVVQGSSKLDGDKAIVYQNAQNLITHIVTLGQYARYSTLPEPGKDRMHARAQLIDYDPNAKIVWLIGDGHVNEGGEVFSGPYIWYNMLNGLVRSSPTEEDQQRTIIILPGSSNNPQSNHP